MHHFQVITGYRLEFHCLQRLPLFNTLADPWNQDGEIWFWYFKPFRCGSRVWQTDGRTDRHRQNGR